jgi:hypothetical protein
VDCLCLARGFCPGRGKFPSNAPSRRSGLLKRDVFKTRRQTGSQTRRVHASQPPAFVARLLSAAERSTCRRERRTGTAQRRPKASAMRWQTLVPRPSQTTKMHAGSASRGWRDTLALKAAFTGLVAHAFAVSRGGLRVTGSQCDAATA